jgi:hypothetical protein
MSHLGRTTSCPSERRSPCHTRRTHRRAGAEAWLCGRGSPRPCPTRLIRLARGLSEHPILARCPGPLSIRGHQAPPVPRRPCPRPPRGRIPLPGAPPFVRVYRRPRRSPTGTGSSGRRNSRAVAPLGTQVPGRAVAPLATDPDGWPAEEANGGGRVPMPLPICPMPNPARPLPPAPVPTCGPGQAAVLGACLGRALGYRNW